MYAKIDRLSILLFQRRQEHTPPRDIRPLLHQAAVKHHDMELPPATFILPVTQDKERL
jgi:hypothetical protein